MSLHCGLSFELAACVSFSILSLGEVSRSQLILTFNSVLLAFILGGFVPSSAAFELKSAAINNVFACQSLLYLASRS